MTRWSKLAKLAVDSGFVELWKADSRYHARCRLCSEDLGEDGNMLSMLSKVYRHLRIRHPEKLSTLYALATGKKEVKRPEDLLLMREKTILATLHIVEKPRVLHEKVPITAVVSEVLRIVEQCCQRLHIPMYLTKQLAIYVVQRFNIYLPIRDLEYYFDVMYNLRFLPHAVAMEVMEMILEIARLVGRDIITKDLIRDIVVRVVNLVQQDPYLAHLKGLSVSEMLDIVDDILKQLEIEKRIVKVAKDTYKIVRP